MISNRVCRTFLLSAALLIPAIGGCGEDDDSEPTVVSYHTYETLDQELQRRLDPMTAKGKKWYTVFFLLILLGPLALPVVLNHPEYSTTKKIIISGITIAVTVVAIYAVLVLFKNVYSSVNDIMNSGSMSEIEKLLSR